LPERAREGPREERALGLRELGVEGGDARELLGVGRLLRVFEAGLDVAEGE